MAPRATSKSKNHKSKGEKKKKEDKLLPTVLDVLVYLPSGDEIILKGISTDRILDVRKLLAVNVETCHLTRFSLSHQVRGDRLNDSQEVMHLKPCVLTVVEEAYTEESAMDHVRRLLDLVSSITCFGPSGKSSVPDKETDGKADGTTGRTESGENSINLKDIKDITKLCPPSELGKFYEFFSFAHLKSPVQGIKISRQAGSKTDFFSIEVKVTNGKILSVTACSTGFYHTGKQQVKCHALVDLLRHLSKSFNDNYEELLKAFCARNKFANIPYGLRANTWVVPPIAAESPSTFPALPAEDETCGGNGGGRGRNPEGLNVPWSQHFSFIAKMACETSEEREVRDHKAFVLHNYFVDVATTHAVAVIRELDSSSSFQTEHVETRGTLKFSVTRDATDPGRKVVWKIESSSTTEFQREISERNVLKGITADESTVVHDTCTLGIVLVRHQGYKVVVEAVPTERTQDIFETMDPPEGGANALNANSLRILLHKKSQRLDTSGEEEKRAKDLLSETIDKAISSVSTQGPVNPSQYFRWELGACWVQHLGEITKANSSEKSDKSGQKPSKDEEPVSEDVSPLKGLLPESSLERLKGTKSGLHLKSVAELMNAAEQYYNNVALPKLVSDFSALELSPVEGRTLTDFMHIRGLRISSLGQLADLCSKLPHIRSLCIHEMIIRAFKHLLRAVVASVKETSELASTIATALNAIFASLPAEGKEEPVEKHVWKWLESFVAARFRWKLAYDSRLNLRKYALLRGICYKVGIEMAPRSYNFNSTTIFSKADVISLVPVYKHAICSSADGRTLLESSKAALDKGKLEEAVSFGSKALTKLIAVCGPYHRMTAGAYSLLAVVLYHTGDFNQAMIYQQKALDINERELGLDHPDTMKSYGDLAVFYYRLQHTELALRYVNRALYLLHLICGPSHPNTAATYINVAMMEEALGNAHVALRYLHEALKCNERLLGKDHIQTAASYHAIAIALSLMEAYTLSVHHEQTTYQILQAKLGPDDIRTQDAAAWLDYFDSKAVEQQEATRTGAPKPDPSVASKGHLSVSDLLDYINKEVSTSSEKDKKPKRLKILTVEDIADSPKQEAGNSSSIQSQEESPIIKEEVSGQVREPPSNAEDRIAKISSSTEVSNAAVISSEEVNEDEGWFEATSRRKTLQRKKFSSSDVSGTSRMGFKGTRPDTPSESGSGTQEKLDVPSDSGTQEKLEVSSGVAEQGQVPSVTTQGNRSYKDVALMMIRPLQQLQQAAVKVAGTKTETKTTGQAEEEDLMSCEGSSSCSSSAAATTPAKTSIPKPAPRPDSQQTTIEVAMTPIRKQVHLPSKTQDCQPSVVTPPPLATPASLFNAPGSPSHHPPPTTPGAKKLMNPFAIEFVPGRKWHPFLPSETNSLQTGGSGSKDQDEKRESQGGVSDGDGDTTESLEQGSPAKPQAEETVKNSELEMAKTEGLQEENLLQEEVAAAAQGSVTQEEQDESFEGEVAITTPSTSLEQEDTGSNKEGIHSDSDERLLAAAGDRDQSGFAAAMASKRWCSSSNFTRSRSRGARWQRRSDGAITRVYRLQEGSSSANPQLKTTSTFTNVPEPHTLQSPASSTLMRRSVRVS